MPTCPIPVSRPSLVFVSYKEANYLAYQVYSLVYMAYCILFKKNPEKCHCLNFIESSIQF